MSLILASLAALLLGPLLFHLARHHAAPLAALDAFVMVAVAGLVMTHILPLTTHTLGGTGALLLALLGLLLAGGLELLSDRLLHSARRLAVPLLLLGVAVHAFMDGLALVAAPEAGGFSALALAVVLHRLPVGLAGWTLVRPRFGLRAVGILFVILTGGTLLGAQFGAALVTLLPIGPLAALQAFLGGILLHLIGHHGLAGGQPRPPFPSRLGSLLGVWAAIAGVTLLNRLPHGDLTRHLPPLTHALPPVGPGDALDPGPHHALYSHAVDLGFYSLALELAPILLAATLLGGILRGMFRVRSRFLDPVGILAGVFLLGTPALLVTAAMLGAVMVLPSQARRERGAASEASIRGDTPDFPVRQAVGDDPSPSGSGLSAWLGRLPRSILPEVETSGAWVATVLCVLALLDRHLGQGFSSWTPLSAGALGGALRLIIGVPPAGIVLVAADAAAHGLSGTGTAWMLAAGWLPLRTVWRAARTQNGTALRPLATSGLVLVVVGVALALLGALESKPPDGMTARGSAGGPGEPSHQEVGALLALAALYSLACLRQGAAAFFAPLQGTGPGTDAQDLIPAADSIQHDAVAPGTSSYRANSTR